MMNMNGCTHTNTATLQQKKLPLLTEMAIPAYSARGDAFLFTLSLKAIPKTPYAIKAKGNIAIALKATLQRMIEIIASLKPEWEALTGFEYFFESEDSPVLIKDARSASLSLVIGLLNLYRALQGKPQAPGLVATGIIRLDGSIQSTHKEDKKHTAFKFNQEKNQQFITSSICQHVFELDYLMDKTQ